jgi:hypothetical protein
MDGRRGLYNSGSRGKSRVMGKESEENYKLHSHPPGNTDNSAS